MPRRWFRGMARSGSRSGSAMFCPEVEGFFGVPVITREWPKPWRRSVSSNFASASRDRFAGFRSLAAGEAGMPEFRATRAIRADVAERFPLRARDRAALHCGFPHVAHEKFGSISGQIHPDPGNRAVSLSVFRPASGAAVRAGSISPAEDKQGVPKHLAVPNHASRSHSKCAYIAVANDGNAGFFPFVLHSDMPIVPYRQTLAGIYATCPRRRGC